MLYDEASLDHLPHLRLPMPTLEQLASHNEPDVTDEVRAVILGHAADGSDVYWVHAQTHQQYRDVTIGQVARVLLDAGVTS